VGVTYSFAERQYVLDAPVLIVDDDPLVVAAIAASLDLRGYPYRTAGNGEEALRAIELIRPALVLLDLHMPVMDGERFIRELRSRGIALPIVLMSSEANVAHWAREVGAAGFLAKPFEIPSLTRLVADVLG
jgi:CheY-like chemotaxis protein